MTPFKSIADIKARGEFIPAGRIYPRRILRAEKRNTQHHVRSGSNQWAFPTPRGYLLFVENNDGEFGSCVHIAVTNGEFQGSPYSNGGTHWQGNGGLEDEQALDVFNKLYAEKNSCKLN